MAKLGIALQLYTVRDLTARDFASAAAEVSRLGYRAVELAGFGSLKSADQVRKVLDEHGLRAVSSHTPLEQLEKAPDKVMDDNEALGNRNLVVPYLPEDRRRDAAGWRAVAGALAEAARAVQPRGFQLAYHNHSFEFQTFADESGVGESEAGGCEAGGSRASESSASEPGGGPASQPAGGKRGIDVLWENTDPDLVRSELDTFWVRHGGEDPVAYIRRLGRRLLLLHLKDMGPGPDSPFAPVGTGLLDFPAILRAAEEQDVAWGIVEQDNTYDLPPLEAARVSLENLKNLGWT